MLHFSKDYFAGLRCRWRLYAAQVVCDVGLACLKPTSLGAIEGYQRLISPHKGYRCAHGVLYGGASCSEFGKRAIQKYGMAGGLILLRQQFRDCHDAAVRIRSGACQVSGASVDDADECIESEHDRGKRNAKESQEYCVGCVDGFCGGD